jgi:hypothetical protein
VFLYLEKIMTTLKSVLSLVMILMALTPGIASAQKLYRCGNVYQDKPCEKAEPTKILSGSAGPAVIANRNVDLSCSQRGAAAQKIMWAREVGKTLDDQLQSDAGTYGPELIQDVYRRRGNSAEVRVAIEDDCMAEKAKAAQTTAMMEAAGLLKAKQSASAAGKETPVATTAPAAPLPTAPLPTADATNKKVLCEALSAQLKTTQDKQRKGGVAPLMEQLNDQRREIEKSQKAFSC